MLKNLLILLITHYSLLIASAQVQQEWVARYNSPANSDDRAYSIALDAVGNIYVTGFSVGSGTVWDYATIKYNPSGVQQWVQRYNGPGNGDDIAWMIKVDASGNAYVTGQSVGSGTGDDYFTIKYSSSGVQLWAARYNGPGNVSDIAYSIAVDGSGNVYVTGQSVGSGTGDDFATIKYDSSGVQQWVVRYNGPANGSDISSSIALDALGNVYVTGTSAGAGTGDDYATIKYNSSGVQQWAARYNGTGNGSDEPYAIVTDGPENIYVTGRSTGSGTNYDGTTVKYNSSGVQQWVQRYNGPGNDIDNSNAMTLDNLGNVYVTGGGIGIGTSFDIATIKYNSSGIQQWVRRYNGPGNGADNTFAITADAFSNVYVPCLSPGIGTNSDYATIKYNSSGDSEWVQRYNGPGNGADYAYGVALDTSGNVYVTGTSTGSGTNFDYATIKYSQQFFSISGQVRFRDNNQPVTSGSVKAVKYDSSSNQIITIDSTGIQPNGNYVLTRIPQDSMDIMCFENDQDDLSFVPTYYVSTIYWQEATTLYPTGNLNNIDILAYRIINSGGQMHIGGGVYISNDNLLIGLKDARVYAKVGNVFKGYSISNTEGLYRVDSLPPGTHELIADRMGYNPAYRTITLTNSSSDTINFYLNQYIISIHSEGTYLPDKYWLGNNYPNPFNPISKIRFGLPKTSSAKLVIYDILGREIATLVNEQLQPGTYEVEFDGSDFPSGVYFYQLTIPSTQDDELSIDFKDTKKMVLIK